jgi:hypothetical protein
MFATAGSRYLSALAVASVAAMCACSKSPSAVHSHDRTGGNPAVGSAIVNACEKDLTVNDVTGIVAAEKVTVSTMSTNPEACSFDAARGVSIVVSLRSGDEIEPFWRLAINQNHNRMIQISGVGNTALRTPGGEEVLARKGDLSCQISVVNFAASQLGKSLKADGSELARKLGALCNKVFAQRS